MIAIIGGYEIIGVVEDTGDNMQKRTKDRQEQILWDSSSKGGNMEINHRVRRKYQLNFEYLRCQESQERGSGQLRQKDIREFREERNRMENVRRVLKRVREF